MPYPKINTSLQAQQDTWGQFNAVNVAQLLANFSVNAKTGILTGGTSGTTVTDYTFIAPDDIRITKVQAIVVTPNVGASNTPTIEVLNGGTVVASSVVALSHSAGDVAAFTLNTTDANLLIPRGTVVTTSIVTPASTVTTALETVVQIEYNTTAELS